MKLKIKQIYWAIKCCITFFPTFMLDNDYDSSSILKLLKKKIQIHRNNIDKHRSHFEWNIHSSQMARAIELINNLLDKDHNENDLKKHNKKWGIPKYLTVKIPGKRLYEFRTVRANVRTDRDQEKENREHLKIYYKQDRMKKQANKELFRLLETKLQSWWY